MKTLGIVTEYNPFHNGHAYQISHAKKLTGATRVVVVMSGNYVQRGEPAIVSKWTRARAALSSGVDLVVELPFVYATLSAELFAYAGISLLNDMGIVDTLVFGSECGNISLLTETAQQLCTPSSEFLHILKTNLSLGHSFPASRESAIRQTLSPIHADELSKPNNILGIEYIKAAVRLNCSFDILTFKRIGAGYHNKDVLSRYPSATALRESFSKNHIPARGLPVIMQDLLKEEKHITSSRFSDMIMAQLRKISPEDLSLYADVSEGLENRIIEMAGQFTDISDVIAHTSTKRYPATRISRILLHVLTGYTREDFDLFGMAPPYIRILGANKTGFSMIKEIKKTAAAFPVIMNLKELRNSPDKAISRMVRLECISTDIYMLASKSESGREFTTSPVILP